MTKYTLDETWKHCLEMWAWIAEQIKANPDLCIESLKSEWLREHDFDIITGNCFFCYYAVGGDCKDCPGRLVDFGFNCTNSEYNYWRFPIKFYEKLLELDKKRKE